MMKHNQGYALRYKRVQQIKICNARVRFAASPLRDFQRLYAEQAYVEKTVINLAKRVGDLKGVGQLDVLRNKHTDTYTH